MIAFPWFQTVVVYMIVSYTRCIRSNVVKEVASVQGLSQLMDVVCNRMYTGD